MTPPVTAPIDAPGTPRTALVLLFLVGVVLLPRLALFFVNENLYGDAVVRTELAERWARSPHWIASFEDGAYQFGPLHLYAVGTALLAGVPREDAGRAVSLFFGVLSVLPLYFLSKRLFGWKAAVWACLAFGAWGFHAQLSTTAASESLSLFLLLWVLALLARGLGEARLGPLLWAAVVLNLACATRYDAWMVIPVFSLLLLVGGRDRLAALTRAVLFFVFCLPFPMVWMQGNELDTGHPLTPVRYIETFHQAWVADGVARYGEWGARLLGLVFWPGAAVVTLSPFVALFAFVGVVYAWRKTPEHRWLLWVMAVPTAYFTFRAAVLSDFVPLARFTVNQVALLLPFVAVGFHALFAQRSAKVRQAVIVAAAVLTAAVPFVLGEATAVPQGRVARALKPVSPLSMNPPEVRAMADVLRDTVKPGAGAVILDSEPDYMDVQLAFYSGLPERQLVRVRWKNFDEKVAELRPVWLVKFSTGGLSKREDVEQAAELLRLGEAWFERMKVEQGLELYRRVDSVAPPSKQNETADLF